MASSPNFPLPDGKFTNSKELFLKTFRGTEDRTWQAEMIYFYSPVLNVDNLLTKSMILKIVNMTDFDIRTFMWIQLSQNKDLTFDNLYLYHILSAVVLQEISKRSNFKLRPIPRDKSWKGSSIIFPSLDEDGLYYWRSYPDGLFERRFRKIYNLRDVFIFSGGSFKLN